MKNVNVKKNFVMLTMLLIVLQVIVLFPTKVQTHALGVTNSGEPAITKTVNGQNHIDLTNIDEQFTYKVSVTIPKSGKYTTAFIFDRLESVLDIKSRTLKIDGINFTRFPGILDVSSGNVIQYNFGPIFDWSKVAGKTMDLEVVAKLKAGIAVGQLNYYIVNGKVNIPNRAKLIVDEQSIDSNVVTVIPPQEAKNPTITKTVNGQNHIDLTNRDDQFTYKISATIPKNVTSFNRFISDKLEDVLEMKSKTLKVEGTDISKYPGILDGSMGNTIQYNLAPSFDWSKVAGKTIDLEIVAKLKNGVTDDQLKGYIVNGKVNIPNRAKLVYDEQPIDSNVVTVTPPEQIKEPKITKTVNGQNHIDLTNRDDQFTYKISATIPKNVTSFNRFISDKIEDVLEVKSKTLKVEGIDISKYPGILDGSMGNTIQYNLAPSFDWSKVAGKTIDLEIVAKLKNGVTDDQLKGYIISGKINIPNRAKLVYDEQPIDSNVVTVTPSK